MESAPDLLSALPDDILVRILSFLPSTEHRVATSLLSRRWTLLWTHVPALDFLSACPAPAVDRSLRLFAAPRLLRFRALVADADPVAAADRWVAAAASKSVLDLSLSLFLAPRAITLPLSPLACSASLRVLNLCACELADLPADPPVFHCLETLFLDLVRITGKKLEAFLSACPNLESLGINRCRKLGRIELSSSVNPHLRNLMVRGEYSSLVVGVPRLSYFHLETYDMRELLITEKMSLCEGGFLTETFTKDWMVHLAYALSKVKVLAASSAFLQLCDVTQIAFRNLKILHWNEMSDSCGFDFFISLLERSPFVEEIFITMNSDGDDNHMFDSDETDSNGTDSDEDDDLTGSDDDDDEEDAVVENLEMDCDGQDSDSEETSDVSDSDDNEGVDIMEDSHSMEDFEFTVKSSVKAIIILDFRGLEEDMEFVRYLLKTMANVGLLRLVYTAERQSKMDHLLMVISEFPRACPDVKISISSSGHDLSQPTGKSFFCCPFNLAHKGR